MGGYQFRLAQDSDSAAVRELIARIYADYPNCVLDVEREEPDLLALRSAFEKKPGKIWVVTWEGSVVGSGGIVRGPQGSPAEIKKLYVDRTHRRKRLAARLCGQLCEQARLWRKARVVAWSDSRFVEAHGFYESFGFSRLSGSRQLFDLSQTIEYPFELRL